MRAALRPGLNPCEQGSKGLFFSAQANACVAQNCTRHTRAQQWNNTVSVHGLVMPVAVADDDSLFSNLEMLLRVFKDMPRKGDQSRRRPYCCRRALLPSLPRSQSLISMCNLLAAWLPACHWRRDCRRHGFCVTLALLYVVYRE